MPQTPAPMTIASYCGSAAALPSAISCSSSPTVGRKRPVTRQVVRALHATRLAAVFRTKVRSGSHGAQAVESRLAEWRRTRGARMRIIDVDSHLHEPLDWVE